MTIGGALLVALILGVFAYVIADSQSQDRQDVERRFRDVAEVSAAVTNGIFQISLAGTQQQAATRFGERTVEPAVLEAFAAQGQLTYAEILDENGKRLAATSKAPPASSETSSAVKAALEMGEPRFSDVIGEGPDAVVESAVPYPTAHGQRIYVSGTPTKVFAEFLSGFLGSVPNFADAESVMIDSRGVILGGSKLSSPVGEVLRDKELLEAALEEEAGEYGDGRYFASAPVTNSPLRVVLDADKNDLYDSISSSRAVPWLLFASFALAALLGLYLLRRAALAGAELQRRQLNEKHAVEINDNIIQGLALAKYQLELGEGEASAAQVSETLREAQRLVSGLLGDAEVQAGQLRREVAAETNRPDDPPPDKPDA